MLKAGSLVLDAEYTSLAMKDSTCIKHRCRNCYIYIRTGLLNEYYDTGGFELSVNDYDNILDEILRRETIHFELGDSDEIDTI
eukprot:7207675-Ditylum_brightwellii.AAC.1